MIQNNKIDFNSKKTIYKTNSSIYFFFRIIIRMTMFLFLIQASLLIFYFIGNYQLFLDTSQKLILNLLAIVSVINFTFSIICSILNFITYVTTKRKTRKFITYIVWYFFTTILSIVTFLLSRGILLLSNGL
jgi:hypothetical protein